MNVSTVVKPRDILNYLRLQALCHPDLTLEPGDFAKRVFDVERDGETHMCRDFETAWDRNTLRWLEWHRFLNEKLDAEWVEVR